MRLSIIIIIIISSSSSSSSSSSIFDSLCNSNGRLLFTCSFVFDSSVK